MSNNARTAKGTEFGWHWSGDDHIRVPLVAVDASGVDADAPRGMLWASMPDRPYEGAGPGTWVSHQCLENLWDAGDPAVDKVWWVRAKIMAAGARSLQVKTGVLGCELAKDLARVWRPSWDDLKIGPAPNDVSDEIAVLAGRHTPAASLVTVWMLKALRGADDAYARWADAPHAPAAVCLEAQERHVQNWAVYGCLRAFEVWRTHLGGWLRMPDYLGLHQRVGQLVNDWLSAAHVGATATLLLHAHRGCQIITNDTNTQQSEP